MARGTLDEIGADRQRIVGDMLRQHPAIPLKKGGAYAKLLGWVRANVQNDNHAAIARHVQAALKVFDGARAARANP